MSTDSKSSTFGFARLVLWGGLSLVILVLAAGIGASEVSLVSIFNNTIDESQRAIFWKMRVPRVLLAFFAGAALSLSGLLYQALFRNPLADPFTLGVASGAALGASLYIACGASFVFWGLSGSTLCALLGAFAVVLVLLWFTSHARYGGAYTVLLAGVVVSFFCSSFILFLQYLSNYAELFKVSRWLMGSLETVGFAQVWGMVIPLMVISGCLMALANQLDLISLGAEFAISRGLSEKHTHRLIILLSSILVGTCVSFCGPIGFVGIIVPHFCRLIVGVRHRVLIPSCFFGGGCFVVIGDVLARSLIVPYEMPVGIVTALLGGPIFLIVLLRHVGKGELRSV